ncbi:MAG: NUDIX hydrolase [Actinobacteria bacterium HGW-Actinobacteria-7]|jgi:8-oxo-dGTP diphosphatase|nr:MAG: NUDIX hydrolase [Actinobacteria bacterium HGW-Actinobacteria-7]
MQYTYDYPRPALCCDTVVFCGEPTDRRVLLVRRGAEPHKDCWALPGGFVDEGERPVAAARRELAEETGLIWEGPLVPIGTFADPGRDPRGWTASAAYLADIGLEEPFVVSGDDAAEARWFSVGKLPKELAFDHSDIVAAALWRLNCL